MTLQTAVGLQQGFGKPGTRAYDTPYRVQPGLLNSTDPTLNIVGRGFGIIAGATGSFNVAADPKTLSVAADCGAAKVFAGLLVEPEVYVSGGTTAGGPLAPTYTLPNGTVVQLATEGDWVVSLAAASNPGDVVYVNYNTGVLTTAAPGAAIPANCYGPVGTVERFVNAAGSPAVVHLEPRVPSLIP